MGRWKDLEKRKRQARIKELMDAPTTPSEFPTYSDAEHELNHTVYRMAERMKLLQCRISILEAANNDLKDEIARLKDC